MTDTALEQLGSAFSQDATTGLFLPTQARKPILPWDDLQAINPPYDLPAIAGSVQPVLAVLSAPGPDRPRLLTSDGKGRLVTSAVLPITTAVAQGAAVNVTTINVVNSIGFEVGDSVRLLGINPGGVFSGLPVAALVDGVPDNHTLILSQNPNGMNIGDIIRKVPEISIDSLENLVSIAIPSSVYTRPLAADIFATNTFTSGVAPSLLLGVANPSLRVRVNYIKISGRNNTTTDWTALFTLSDGVTTFWQGYFSVPARPPTRDIKVIEVSVNPVNLGSGVIIPGLAGQTVILKRMTDVLSGNTGRFGTFESTSGVGVAQFNESLPRTVNYDWIELPLPVGDGFQYRDQSNMAGTFHNISITFAQLATFPASYATDTFDNIAYAGGFGKQMTLASASAVPTGVSIALDMAGSERSD